MMGNKDEPDNKTRVSERFCSADADITFQSSDNVQFKFYHKNLDVCSGGFATADLVSDQAEIVPLSETSAVVDLLLQFMSPIPQPKLGGLPIELLMSLAEAAEKYQVYPVLPICMVHLRAAENLKDHAAEIFDFAVKHGHTDLMDDTARMLVGTKLVSAEDKLSPLSLRCLIRYIDLWTEAIKPRWDEFMLMGDDAHNSQDASPVDDGWGVPNRPRRRAADDGWGVPDHSRCREWNSVWRALLMQRWADLDAVTGRRSIDYAVITPCSKCSSLIHSWRVNLQETVAAIPKCSTLL